MVEEFPKEEDVKKKRAELDEKYPFEPVENMIPADEAPADNAEQTADVQPDAADDDVKIRPELKREKPDKFGKLKFGDNYDVE